MTSSIVKFLNEHYTDSVFYSHVSLIPRTGKYQFNRDSIEEFWRIYCTTVLENDDTENPQLFGIAEKPEHYLPVLVDFDIKILNNSDIEIGEHLYTDDQLKQIVQIFQSVLRNIVEGCTEDNLLCIVLEKPIYYVNSNNVSYIKNGFHLSFSNIFLSKSDQEVHLFPRVKEILKTDNVFESLGFESSEHLLDASSTKVPWLMYGSRKNEKQDAYKVTRVINSEGEEIDIEEALKYYQLFDSREELINIKGQVKYFLPRILSTRLAGRSISELKHGLVSPLKVNTVKKQKEKNTNMKISVTEALKESEKLITMLGDFRVSDRNAWMEIGWILYNIGEGCDEALEQWLEFSARDEDKYDECICIAEWEKMTKKDYTLGTLKYYAKLDSPELYEEYKQEQGQKHVQNALNGNHYDIAKLMYEEHGTDFVCSSITNKTWFYFSGNRWEEIEEGVFLRDKISTDIVEKFALKGGEFFSQAASTDKANEKKIYENIKNTQNLISKLKNSSYKNGVMRECCDIFYDRNFKHKLDQNPYLIGFKNGVYDLKMNIFRNGKPEDYLSKSMNIEYTNFDPVDNRVLAVYDFLEKVFPDTSIRQYFMDQASDVFVGGNHQKVVLFWTGDGDNAKSVTQNIFEKMLGEYAIKFSTTLLTGKKVANGAANPELARAGGGVRWAVLEEPDGDEEINIGYLKTLSGDDSYFTRDLFEKGKQTREIKPQFKLVFICNKLPNLKHADKATWNRVRVIPFESTFVRPGDECPETYEEQLLQKRFPMDREFSKKIPDLLQAFAWVLLQHRQNIKVRIEPEKVRMATAMYQKQNDSYRQYIEECIKSDSDKYITLIELYSSFKDWYKEGFPGRQIPNKNEISEYFTKIWGEPMTGMKWKGYRLKTLQDDIDNGDAVLLEDDDLVDYDRPDSLI